MRLLATEGGPQRRMHEQGTGRTQATQTAATALPSPDWYPDPGVAGQWRYWDGASWTMHVAPMRRSWTGRVTKPAGRP